MYNKTNDLTCLFRDSERNKMVEKNRQDIRYKLTEIFRDELPMLRAKAKVSQEIVAEKVGISRQTYSSIETGKRDMSWTIFLALFAYFQNNEQTRLALGKVDGLEKEIVRYFDETTIVK